MKTTATSHKTPNKKEKEKETNKNRNRQYENKHVLSINI